MLRQNKNKVIYSTNFKAHTLCSKKVVHKTHGNNFVNS